MVTPFLFRSPRALRGYIALLLRRFVRSYPCLPMNASKVSPTPIVTDYAPPCAAVPTHRTVDDTFGAFLSSAAWSLTSASQIDDDFSRAAAATVVG
ncbi:hypothetical protein NUW54_g1981 [Trametes sanguinea]|uniref:Uncharacterized protein n=1 Tax=Trametes sanguinea TaxID=158606 RepID=A0ACC1Q656_9APHY|nr:hypothetical protein NUW54_g1981 [Trametes sanguinea]